MSRLWALLLAVLLPAAMPVAHAAVTISAAELTSDEPGRALLVLRLSGEVKPRLFRLEEPHRVVLDLPGVQLAPGLKLPAATGPVTLLRSGSPGNGTLRLVLETRGPLSGNAELSGSRAQGWQLRVPLTGNASAGVPATASAGKAAAAPVAGPTPAPGPAQPVKTAPRAEGRDIIVAIDPGHGGQDPGAIGRNGTREKDVVLGIAQALARRVDAEPGMKAFLTRTSDRFIPLRERINLARNARADIFISIHADAIANRSVSGSSVYVLSERGASSEAARWLAERENAADLKGGVALADQGPLASVLMDLSQSASIGSSMEAAEKVLTYMDRVGQVRKTQVQQAAFVVLKSPDIPSMLVETAYISNPREEQRLRSREYQEKIANAIFSGVRDYFRTSPPDGTLYAQQRRRGGAAPIMAVQAGS